METINASIKIEDNINAIQMLKNIERYGRVAYKSEDKITEDSAIKFVKMLLKLGHESVLEHEKITIRVICDRGITHEIVRHRIASYTQESTRYCNYTKGKFGSEIKVIKPAFWNSDTQQDKEKYQIWENAMKFAEESYKKLIELGATPQEARSVLPNSLKTEIIITMNLREWRHFLKLRTDKSAHPQMIEIANMIKEKFQKQIPVIFDDL